VAAALANFILPILCQAADSPYVVVFTTGIVAAQFGVLSVIGALGASRHVVRLSVTFAVALVLLMALVVGAAASAGNAVDPDAVRIVSGFFLLLPALLLSAQAPLWLYRGVSGRRLMDAALQEASGKRYRPQFGIADMLTTTALIAVSLALARGAVAIWNLPEAGDNVERGLAPILIGCAALAAASAVVTLPCTLATLVARHPAAWTVPVLVYSLVVSSIVVLASSAITGRMPPGEAVGWFTAFSLSTFGGILAGLGLIRKTGYALVR
jgi:hypothetical protein